MQHRLALLRTAAARDVSRNGRRAPLLTAIGLAAALPLSACSRGGLDGDDPPPSPDGGGDPALDGAAGPDGGGDSRDLTPDGAPASDDPFDAASCGGPPWTAAQALARLGAADRLKLGDGTLYRRSRSCTGMTADTCGPWGAPAAHTQSLLTYSGGVTTDYKTFSFPTHLILFSQAGQPKLSVRHESDYRHDASASTRGVVFPFGMDPLENSYPIIYVWDFAPKPNRYEDLQGLMGDDGYLYARERCARVVFKSGVSSEVAALYRY